MKPKAVKFHANRGKIVANGKKEKLKKHNMYAEFYKFL